MPVRFFVEDIVELLENTEMTKLGTRFFSWLSIFFLKPFFNFTTNILTKNYHRWSKAQFPISHRGDRKRYFSLCVLGLDKIR
jgi:hypothetical protein